MSEEWDIVALLSKQLAAQPKANKTTDPATTEDAVLYARLGSVVRQLHDALKELGYGQTLDAALREISDSQGRLEHIATLAEQSANKVLNAVDDSLPIQDQQISQANALLARKALLIHGEEMTSDLSALMADFCRFASEVAINSESEKSRLMDIMMAQDFQDITGQIIKKVLTLTQKLEKELAQLLRDYASTPVEEKPHDLLAGPVTPDLAMDQDDVDSLLDDLGF